MTENEIKNLMGEILYGDNDLTTEEKKYARDILRRDIGKSVKIGGHPQLWLLPKDFYLCPQCHDALCEVEGKSLLMYVPRCPRCGQKLKWE